MANKDPAMNPSPIALFVYNRLWHAQRTIQALQNNNLSTASDLFIFSDGPKNSDDAVKIAEIRNFLKKVTGFETVTIIERPGNWGLSKSIMSGVGEIVNRFGKIIVVEDDIVTSPYFLTYMNDALNLYEHEETVISIHGYVYPMRDTLPEIFFIKGADCWGWATWKRGWDLFEPDGKILLSKLEQKNLIPEFNFNGSCDYGSMLRKQISGGNDSWAVRWYASAFLKNKLTLYPGRIVVVNIGMDGSGIHSGSTNQYSSTLADSPIVVTPIETKENFRAREAFEKYFNSLKPTPFRRILKKLTRLLK